MKNIVIRGAYGETNFGDDLLMCVLENYFISNFPRFNIFFIPMEKNDYMGKLLRTASIVDPIGGNIEVIDLLVYGGGTQFFVFRKTSNRFFEKVNNFRYLLMNDFSKLISMILEKAKIKKSTRLQISSIRYAAIGIGIGPFKEYSKKVESSKQFLNNASFLAVRDQRSLDYCIDWGFHDVILGADICFSDYFTEGQFIQTRNEPPIHTGKKIGVIVRDWMQDEEGKEYFHPLMNVIERYENIDEYEFIYIIFAPNKDKEWGKLLKSKKLLIWDPNANNVNEFFNILESFNGFITARYHGGVFAALMNKPTICIEIEPKLRILTEQIPELQLWEKPFSEDKLSILIENLFKAKSDYSLSIGKLKEKSNKMFGAFTSFINDNL